MKYIDTDALFLNLVGISYLLFETDVSYRKNFPEVSWYFFSVTLGAYLSAVYRFFISGLSFRDFLVVNEISLLILLSRAEFLLKSEIPIGAVVVLFSVKAFSFFC